LKYNPLELKKQLISELTHNILPFWMEKMKDDVHGGFYGQIKGNGQLIEEADKGGILNARILWTFSAAYRSLKNPAYLAAATSARDYIFNHFFDSVFEGTYWSVDYLGNPRDTKKQIYSQAFFIYALAEYYQATGDNLSLEAAINLFRLIEKYSFDPISNGYFEACSREWKPLDDMRLSDKDANEKKTMNTHLHILEAYTNLFRIWKDETIAPKLTNLINIFLDKIIDNQSWHLNLFFEENWNCKSTITSYGHDIESSWLLYEAALDLNDNALTEKVKKACLKIADASIQGLQKDGSLVYEKNNLTGYIDYERHWWPQSEAVVGFFNAFELTRESKYLQFAIENFRYIKENLLDTVNGEWFWSIMPDGSVNRKDDKAGFWKCPYHNSRMCLEIIRRIESED
jgi:cellobiose epimerase